MELGYNPIGPEGAEVLCEVLKFHGNIHILKLGWCQVIDSLNYAYLILEFCTLWDSSQVYIPNNILLQLGAKGAEYIADMLRYNSTLSDLDLRGNGLRDEVCCFI